MSNLQETINTIKNDLTSLEISREEFLALCAKERIDSQIKKYDAEFDKFLKSLEVSTMYSKDLSKVASFLKTFSDISITMYDNLINEIDRYQKNIFDKFG